jgi:hypothetical protein
MSFDTIEAGEIHPNFPPEDVTDCLTVPVSVGAMAEFPVAEPVDCRLAGFADEAYLVLTAGDRAELVEPRDDHHFRVDCPDYFLVDCPDYFPVDCPGCFQVDCPGYIRADGLEKFPGGYKRDDLQV